MYTPRPALSMLNKKELEMQRIEPLWSLSGTHALIFSILLSSLAVA